MSSTQSDTTQFGGAEPPEKAPRDERRGLRDWRKPTGTVGDAAVAASDEARILLGALTVFAVIAGTMNYLDVLGDLHNAPQYGMAQPIIWEGTSWLTLMVAFFVPWAAQRYFPLDRPPLWRTILVYAAAAPVFTLIHVAGFVALRMAIYSAAGAHYNFGPIVPNFEYEASRDVLGYVGAISLFWSARRLVRDARRNRVGDAPLFDIRDGARLIRVRFDDILALTSAGNYVEFVLRDGRRPLMRKPLSAMEVELGPRGFVRTHRSWLVNAMQVTGLKPEGSGDYEIEVGTVTVPLSRRFPEALAKLRAG